MCLYIHKKVLLAFLGSAIFHSIAYSQSYTSYFTGDTTDINIQPTFGICLMGGATEDDNAMTWFLQRANGGDVVVIRASGGNGYNDYLFSDLGITVNSVETLVLPDSASARHPYVRRRLQEAEAIFIAGGDQYNYHRFWKNSAVDSALTHLVNVKGGPVGGTSAGMAILGGAYFSAQNGTVTSAQALNNPYDNKVALVTQPFVNIPILTEYITDTHFDNPDRRGRTTAFLGRLTTDLNMPFNAIACDEYTAVCIDSDGKAVVFGGDPQYPDDYAYFIHSNCESPFAPETCTSGTPLIWNLNQKALYVYRIAGNATGNRYRHLSQLNDFSGGEWLKWYVANGSLSSSPGEAFEPCTENNNISEAEEIHTNIYPNPTADFISVYANQHNFFTFQILDMQGKTVQSGKGFPGENIGVNELSDGIYVIKITSPKSEQYHKLIINR